MTKKITLSSIAKKSGMSIASVSRVVHSPHLTTQKTKNRIYAAMKELEFDLKKHLKDYSAKNHSKKIVIVDNQLVPHNLIHQGIEDVLKKTGYQLVFFRLSLFDETTLQKLVQHILSHQISGILIINDAPYLAEIDKYLPFLPPVLLLNQFKVKMPCSYFDHLAMGFNATQHLIKNGHKQILLLLSDENNHANQQMILGYKQALQRFGLFFEPLFIFYRANHYYSLKKQLATHLSETSKTSAIICADCSSLNYLENEQNEDHAAEIIDNLLAIIESQRIDPLKLFSIIFTTYKKKHLANPRLNFITSIYKPFYEMGFKGAEQLLRKIENPNHKIQSILIDQEWNERSSVKPYSAMQKQKISIES